MIPVAITSFSLWSVLYSKHWASRQLSDCSYRFGLSQCFDNEGLGLRAKQLKGRLKMRDMNLRHQFARVEIAGWKCGTNLRGGKCGKSYYGKPKCEKVSQSSCICVQSYSFNISLCETEIYWIIGQDYWWNLWPALPILYRNAVLCLALSLCRNRFLSAGVTFCLLLFLRCQIYDE